LAIYRVQQGKSAEAILLWERVLARHPAQAAPAMNLALYYAQQGRAGDAQRTLERLLRFQPDLAAARKFLATLREER
jgi:predicted Zn-dependent protease